MRNFTEITFTSYDESQDTLSGFFTVWENCRHKEGDLQPHVIDLDFFVTKICAMYNIDADKQASIAVGLINEVKSGDFDLSSPVLEYVILEAEILAVDIETEATIKRIQKKQDELIQQAHSYINKMFAKLKDNSFKFTNQTTEQ